MEGKAARRATTVTTAKQLQLCSSSLSYVYIYIYPKLDGWPQRFGSHTHRSASKPFQNAEARVQQQQQHTTLYSSDIEQLYITATSYLRKTRLCSGEMY